MIKRVVFIWFILNLNSLFSQRVLGMNFIFNNSLHKEYASHNYDRLGVSIFCNKAEYAKNKFYEDPKSFFKLPYNTTLFSKFDHTSIDYDISSIIVPRKKKHRNYQSKRDYVSDQIKKDLIQNKISNKIIKKLNSPWSVSNSPYAPAEVMRRFNLNVTNNDLARVKSLRHNINSSNFLDSLYSVYTDNYIVVHSFKKIRKMSEVYAYRRYFVNAVFSIFTLGLVKYEEQDEMRVDLMDGYKIKGTSYLYQIKLSNNQIDNILKSYRTGGNINVIDNLKINIEFVDAVDFRVKEEVLNTRNYNVKLNKAKENLSYGLHRNTIGKFENKVGRFQVKRMVENGRPIRVEVGSKEGVKLNQRFLVYNTHQDKDGKLYKRPIGAVRISRIAENKSSNNTLSENVDLSQVKQFQGRSISGGETIKQWNGLGVELGYRYSLLGGVNPGLNSLDIVVDLSEISRIRNLKLLIGSNSNTAKMQIGELFQLGLINIKNPSSNVFYLPKDAQEGNFVYSNVGINTTAKTMIFGISRIGLVWDYSFLNNFYSRISIGYKGIEFNVNEGATIGYGTSINYSTLSKITLNGAYGGLDLGFYLSPSIAIFGNIEGAINKVRYFGNYVNEYNQKQPFNSCFSFGCRIEL